MPQPAPLPSPPYAVVPSFQARHLNGIGPNGQYTLTSHKELEDGFMIPVGQPDEIQTHPQQHGEHELPESDESPPYLPAVKPTAPPTETSEHAVQTHHERHPSSGSSSRPPTRVVRDLAV